MDAQLVGPRHRLGLLSLPALSGSVLARPLVYCSKLGGERSRIDECFSIVDLIVVVGSDNKRNEHVPRLLNTLQVTPALAALTATDRRRSALSLKFCRTCPIFQNSS